MDSNYKTVNIFPVPVHQFDIDEFYKSRNQLINYAYTLKNRDPIGNQLSNYGGWQSKLIHLSDGNDYLFNFVVYYLTGLLKHHVLQESIAMKVVAWVNINNQYAFNVEHCHPGCDLTGVLWVKCPENCGEIVFINPLHFQIHGQLDSYLEDFKNKNKYDRACCFKPEEGRMLVFPSHLMHRVGQNKSFEDRISISFNISLLNNYNSNI